MDRISRLPQDERSELFSQVAQKMGMSEAVVEKDFWVCLVLDYLFSASPYLDSVVFKGGTSLSKAYGLISRFSEDVDLIIDWRELGYGIDEPWEERSKTKQDKFNKETIERTNLFLKESFIPKMQKGLSERIGSEAKLLMADGDQTILFSYPRSFASASTLDNIRLEIGPLAAWTPFELMQVTSYTAEIYPDLFNTPSSVVRTVKPERTFWEKASILHQEHYRPAEKPMPSRYARHYYDLYMLGNSWVFDSALDESGLLAKVVAFKDRFYPAGWARFDLANLGEIKLVPQAGRLGELERDYSNMYDMFVGDTPTFSDLISFVEELEERIHVVGNELR
jgi:hypothetical protein